MVDLLKVSEASAMLRVSRCTIYQAIKDRSIPAVRIGRGTIRIPKAAIEKMLGESDEQTAETERVAV